MAFQGMSAADIRQAVRNITDLDSEDLSDSLLNLYIRDGYYRILDMNKRWPFLEFSFSFTTRVQGRDYELASITSEPIGQIVSLVDNSGQGTRLDLISFDEAEMIYTGTYDSPSDPLFYAVWGGSIHLYPKPSAVITLTARGYREPLDWQTEGGDVDASPTLHFPLVYYACSRVYQQLEDSAMAQMYKGAFDEGVSMAMRNINTPPSHVPLVLSSNNVKNKRNFDSWLQSLGQGD